MAEFIVRVELRGGTVDDYEVLDRAMLSSGFGINVTGTNGLVYKLPAGEYYTDLHSSAEIARLQAAAAAATSGRPFSVLITPIGGPLYWQNLQRA